MSTYLSLLNCRSLPMTLRIRHLPHSLSSFWLFLSDVSLHQTVSSSSLFHYLSTLRLFIDYIFVGVPKLHFRYGPTYGFQAHTKGSSPATRVALFAVHFKHDIPTHIFQHDIPLGLTCSLGILIRICGKVFRSFQPCNQTFENG